MSALTEILKNETLRSVVLTKLSEDVSETARFRFNHLGVWKSIKVDNKFPVKVSSKEMELMFFHVDNEIDILACYFEKAFAKYYFRNT